MPPMDFSIDSINAKKALALQVKEQLQREKIFLRGKTVLDVRFGLGFNAQAMATLGATVYGVETNAEAYAWAIQEKTMLKEHAFRGRLQDMPKDTVPSVDLITFFLWNVSIAHYDAFLAALSGTISRAGTVIIGFNDEIYKDDPYGVAVPPHARRYFGQVDVRPCPGDWNTYLLICTKPRL